MLAYCGISGLEASFFVSIPLLYWFHLILGSMFETAVVFKKKKGCQSRGCLYGAGHFCWVLFFSSYFSLS
ncbi:hypothetical protein ACQKWADRAFT_285257 [Trichoderma austrokoningii]